MNDKIEDTKQCTKCLETKPIEKFEFNKKWRRNECRNCRNSNPLRKQSQKYNKLLLRYKLTKEKYDSMIKEQHRKCAICNQEKPLVVDHDHKCCPGIKSCGKCIRKLICDHCNVGLGRFDDSIEYLEQAINYLKEYRKKEIDC